MKNNNILITICARGKSKGLSGKHLEIFHGKPLIAWTIEQARDWGKADIIVSSDDSDILDEVNTDFGNIIAYKRPKKLAGGNIPKLDAIRDALLAAEKQYKKKYSIVVDLDATNPLRKMKDIETCFGLLIRKEQNTVVSVVKSRRSPYFNMVEVLNGKAILCKRPPHNTTYRRQDVPYTYDLNCSIYVYGRNWLLDEDNKSPITEKTELYVMPDETFCDIDTELDFKIVEYIAKEYLIS